MRLLKALLLFSASVLMLALAAHLAGVDIDLPSTSEAKADFNPADGGVVGLLTEFDSNQNSTGWRGQLLLSDGSVVKYNADCNDDFENDPDFQQYPMPFSMDQIKFWNGRTFVLDTDEVWVLWTMSCGTQPMGWKNLGTPPGLPVSAADSSVGDLKGSFRGN